MYMCVFSQRKANILLLSSCCNQIRFCQNIFTASHSSCTVAPCFFEQEKVVATYKNINEKQKVYFCFKLNLFYILLRISIFKCCIFLFYFEQFFSSNSRHRFLEICFIEISTFNLKST